MCASVVWRSSLVSCMLSLYGNPSKMRNSYQLFLWHYIHFSPRKRFPDISINSRNITNPLLIFLPRKPRETMKSEVNFEHCSETYWQVRRVRSTEIDEEFAFSLGFPHFFLPFWAWYIYFPGNLEYFSIYANMAVVVQLVRAPDCESGCCEFKPRRSPQVFFIFISLLFYDNSRFQRFDCQSDPD